MRPGLVAVLFFFIGAFARPANAQLYFAGYFGGNHTQRAAVSIDLPAADTAIVFDDVEFSAEAVKAPVYYGARVGWIFGTQGRYGIEVEFIHLKAIANTSGEYGASGRLAGLEPGRQIRMDTIVQRYSMTHGLNFVVINGVVRRPLRERVVAVVRAGAGATVPHAESQIFGVVREQYEYAGAGAHAAAGIEMNLVSRVALTGEYKFTYAKPKISIAGGVGRTTAATHHIAVGFRVDLVR